MKDAQLAPSEQSLTKECGWKDGDRGGPAQTEKPLIRKRKTDLTLTGLLMEGLGNETRPRSFVPDKFLTNLGEGRWIAHRSENSIENAGRVNCYV
jgi:hypothetical protein